MVVKAPLSQKIQEILKDSTNSKVLMESVINGERSHVHSVRIGEKDFELQRVSLNRQK